MFEIGLPDEKLRRLFTLSSPEKPSDDVSAEHVEQHVEVEPLPWLRTPKPSDVPTPELAGPCGKKLWPLVGGSSTLSTTILNLVVFA
jgi:hypothetical protein